jgi:hypothetical protein
MSTFEPACLSPAKATPFAGVLKQQGDWLLKAPQATFSQ